jgi:hypothetical protein
VGGEHVGGRGGEVAAHGQVEELVGAVGVGAGAEHASSIAPASHAAVAGAFQPAAASTTSNETWAP